MNCHYNLGLVRMNRGHFKKYSLVLVYASHQQHSIPPIICIIHSKDTINKPLFSTSSIKYRKCKPLDSFVVH
jgi:hypothetical protein